jgi:hypothetical protein
MKIHLILISTGLICVSNASFTLNYEFKNVLNASGANVPTGSLWALVVDNNNDTFAGFGLNDSLYNQTAGTADAHFITGSTSISLGAAVGGGTVFSMGAFSSAGIAGGTASSLTLGTNGLAAGQQYAFYWFPDVAYTVPGSYLVQTQVGGMHTTDVPAFLDIGMDVPASDGVFTTGAYSLSSLDGNVPDNNFRSVTLIPEPSAALLGSLGVLVLLRRRRN